MNGLGFTPVCSSSSCQKTAKYDVYGVTAPKNGKIGTF